MLEEKDLQAIAQLMQGMKKEIIANCNNKLDTPW